MTTNDQAIREALFLKSYSDAQHTGKAEDWMTAAINAKLMHDAALAQTAATQCAAPVRVLSDAEMESAFKRGGGRWDGDRWGIEDADLLPAIRAILAASTGASDAK